MTAKAPAKPAKPKGPQPRHPVGAKVRFKAPPTPLGGGVTYASGTATVLETYLNETGETFESCRIRWDNTNSEAHVWALDIEPIPEEKTDG